MPTIKLVQNKNNHLEVEFSLDCQKLEMNSYVNLLEDSIAILQSLLLSAQMEESIV
jgi:hypothetical protein